MALVEGTYGVTDNTIILKTDHTVLLNLVFRQLQAKQLNKMVFGSGQPLITGTQIKSLYIPIPPTVAEQRAIAEALSDVDELIGSLEKLIDKKRAIKTAVMQQLLTGKQRLPGFDGEWEMKRLGDFGSTYGGLSGKTKEDFGVGRSQYISFMNIMNNVVVDSNAFERVEVAQNESQNLVMMGDLFFNGSSETPEEVGLCSVLSRKVESVFLNSFCFGFRLKKEAEIDGLYLAYFFRSNSGRELLKSLAQGATRYNLSKRALLLLEFPIPTKAEQTAIASVLSDMDAEIQTLEARLEKTKAIKQGMMQELLTGKVRLV